MQQTTHASPRLSVSAQIIVIALTAVSLSVGVVVGLSTFWQKTQQAPTIVQARPVPAVKPYAELCFAPEWWLINSTLSLSNAPEAAKASAAAIEAHGIFCNPDVTERLTEEQETQRRSDALNILLRLKSYLPEVLMAPDRAKVLGLRIEVLMTMFKGNP